MTFRPQLRHRLPRGGTACDFCGTPEITALYQCHNFTFQDFPVFKSDLGRWAACWGCSSVIEVQRWGQLNRRVMREVAKRKGITEYELAALKVSLRELHAAFAKNVIDGEALTVLKPHVRRFVLADGS